MDSSRNELCEDKKELDRRLLKASTAETRDGE
jgi:hypothetical protein